MLRILIIDTEKTYNSVKTAMQSLYSGSDFNISIDFNESPEVSWKQILDNPYRYDTVMINISVSAEQLREELDRAESIYEANRKINIIFLTGFALVPRDVWKVPHIYIMRKPVMREDVRCAMERVNCILNEERKNFSSKMIVKHGKLIQIISEDSVIYAARTRQGVRIVTETGEICHCQKLEDFAESMSDIFCRCHNSYVVNFSHVIRVRKECIEMDNGENIAVSRAYRKSVQCFVDRLSAYHAENRMRRYR